MHYVERRCTRRLICPPNPTCTMRHAPSARHTAPLQSSNHKTRECCTSLGTVASPMLRLPWSASHWIPIGLKYRYRLWVKRRVPRERRLLASDLLAYRYKPQNQESGANAVNVHGECSVKRSHNFGRTSCTGEYLLILSGISYRALSRAGEVSES